MIRTNIRVLWVILAVLAAGCGGDGGSVAEPGAWLAFNEGMKAAADTGKPVVIDFYTSWCRWCKVMDRDTFSDPEVKAYLEKNFVTIRLDAENRSDQLTYRGQTYTPVELTKKFAVRGYPSLAYLENDGEIIMVVTGFKKPAEFLPTLRYVKDGCYRNDVRLDDYLKNGDCGG
ncbi:MAG TPA: thioredoxin family protein [Candidatus Krumholzibacterium sp.]|nr:thioredoxin family protein [Candidatus Krumholzibacterium sp.]